MEGSGYPFRALPLAWSECKSLQRFTVQKDIPIELLRCLRENPWFRFMQMVYADKQQLLKPLCYSLKLVFTH